MYADGCVLPKTKYGEQTFKLQLQLSDIDVLQKFQEDLQSTYPIRYDNSGKKKHSNWQTMVLLEQRSQKTVDDLKKLGCVERKSLILTFPTEKQVPKKFIYDFIRGYFDGDGSISINFEKQSYHVCFVGTESFIKGLSNYFSKGSVVKDKRKSNSWYFSMGGKDNVINFYHLLYDNAHRYMNRKYYKFQTLLS